MTKITIFTPTYNRGYIISNLYQSLLKQTNRNFIWLVIDDGSRDNTSLLFDNWMKDKLITIQYYKQKNQGKSMAHNKGVNLTKTELFTCVDSDDYLSPTAVEEILKAWEDNKSYSCVGILSFRAMPDGSPITILKDKICKATTLRGAYENHGLRGDTMLIFQTNIIFPLKFPYFEGEKFVPEAYLYDQIDQLGKLLIYPKVLYYCQYLDDGYTRQMSALLAQNPEGYIAYITQRLLFDNNIKSKLFDSIRYVSMCIVARKKNIIRNSPYPIITLLAYVAGFLLYRLKYSNFVKDGTLQG